MEIQEMSMSTFAKSFIASRGTRMLMMAGIAGLVLLPETASAQPTTACGPEVKEAVLRRLASVEGAADWQKTAVYAELYAQYKYCTADAQSVSSVFHAAAQ